jgi:PhnB protein
LDGFVRLPAGGPFRLMSIQLRSVRLEHEITREEEGTMAGRPQANDEAEIRALIDRWAQALRDKDADAVLSCHADGVVQFSLAPPLISTATDAEGLNAWFATWRGGLGYELHGLRIAVGGDAAFSHSLNRLRGTKIDGAANELWFRHTLGFRRLAGEWKIVHEHESVPFYMDGSYRAAVDLTP